MVLKSEQSVVDVAALEYWVNGSGARETASESSHPFLRQEPAAVSCTDGYRCSGIVPGQYVASY